MSFSITFSRIPILLQDTIPIKALFRLDNRSIVVPNPMWSLNFLLGSGTEALKRVLAAPVNGFLSSRILIPYHSHGVNPIRRGPGLVL